MDSLGNTYLLFAKRTNDFNWELSRQKISKLDSQQKDELISSFHLGQYKSAEIIYGFNNKSYLRCWIDSISYEIDSYGVIRNIQYNSKNMMNLIEDVNNVFVNFYRDIFSKNSALKTIQRLPHDSTSTILYFIDTNKIQLASSKAWNQLNYERKFPFLIKNDQNINIAWMRNTKSKTDIQLKYPKYLGETYNWNSFDDFYEKVSFLIDLEGEYVKNFDSYRQNGYYNSIFSFQGQSVGQLSIYGSYQSKISAGGRKETRYLYSKKIFALTDTTWKLIQEASINEMKDAYKYVRSSCVNPFIGMFAFTEIYDVFPSDSMDYTILTWGYQNSPHLSQRILPFKTSYGLAIFGIDTLIVRLNDSLFIVDKNQFKFLLKNPTKKDFTFIYPISNKLLLLGSRIDDYTNNCVFSIYDLLGNKKANAEIEFPVGNLSLNLTIDTLKQFYYIISATDSGCYYVVLDSNLQLVKQLTPLSTSRFRTRYPVGVVHNDSLFVAWEDDRDGGSDIYGRAIPAVTEKISTVEQSEKSTNRSIVVRANNQKFQFPLPKNFGKTVTFRIVDIHGYEVIRKQLDNVDDMLQIDIERKLSVGLYIAHAQNNRQHHYQLLMIPME